MSGANTKKNIESSAPKHILWDDIWLNVTSVDKVIQYVMVTMVTILNGDIVFTKHLHHQCCDIYDAVSYTKWNLYLML